MLLNIIEHISKEQIYATEILLGWSCPRLITRLLARYQYSFPSDVPSSSVYISCLKFAV